MVLARLLGAFLSGALFTLALPQGELALLAWVAFVPLLLATRGIGVIPAFVLALLSIFAAAATAVLGPLNPHRAEGPDGWLYTSFGLFGFAIAVGVAVWGDKSTGRWPGYSFAGLTTLLEAALLVELPAHIALTQYRSPLMLGVASIAGIWAVSFLLWWANFAIAQAVLDLKSRRTGLLLAGALPGISLASMILPLPAVGGSSMKVGLVQTDDTDAGIIALHRQASSQGAELAVWPEFAGIVLAPNGDGRELRALTASAGVAPLITSFRDDHNPPRNVASVFGPQGESERYAKRRLFGGEKAMHTPGSLAASATVGSTVIGLNICFDSCFPSVIRETAALPGAALVALPTIDPPSRNHFVAAMHSAYTPFRAAENGISIVRTDAFAYSQVVDPWGRIIAELPPGEKVRVVEVPLARPFRLATKVGDGWLVVCGLLFLVGAWRSSLKALPTPQESQGS